MSERNSYSINTDVKYGQLEVIDVPAIVAGCNEKWFNQTLTQVNDSVVRLGIVQGEFHWHKHDSEDEFFFVLEGRLFIDLQDRTVELRPGQGVTIPRSVMHRPRAPQKTVMLMVESRTIEPTGNQPETLDSRL
jgi:mannose-6-phosphate isomerase-like protein (cupin superfamily)